MKPKFLFINLLLACCLACSNKKSNDKNDTSENSIEQKYGGDFIGYFKTYPVFCSVDTTNILYLMKDNKVMVYRKLLLNSRGLFANDKGIIFQNSHTKEIGIIKVENDSSITIPYSSFLESVTASRNLDTIVLFDDYDENLRMLSIRDQRILVLTLKGHYPKLIGNEIFYSLYSDSTSSEPNSVLYRTRLTDLGKSELLIKEIHEDWQVSPDGKHIVCKIIKDHEWANAIFNVENKSVMYIKDDMANRQSYFRNDGEVVFYQQSNITIDTVITVK